MPTTYGYIRVSTKDLCLYLAYQNIAALAPKHDTSDKPLSQDAKNIRWALNKFFYNQNKNSLNVAYAFMLKEKYSDPLGNLHEHYPTFNQFRYYYLKNRKMQTYYISRNYNFQMIKQQEYTGIIGGADCFTIIGCSGIGKSTAISRAITAITENRIVEISNPYSGHCHLN